MVPTLQFDPKDQSLKFPLNENDNEDTTLLKTILNILFKFREEIEEYHGTYEFRDELSWGRIGRLFGTKTNIMDNYLNVIQKTSTEQAIFYIIEKTWLKFVINIEDNFKEKYHIEPIYSLLDSALEQYAQNAWGKIPWTLEVRQIFSTYSQRVFSESVLSERLGRGHNYVNTLKQKGKGEHEEHSKFFRFLVEVFLADPTDFELNEVKDYEKIKKECLDLVYDYMCKAQVSGEDARLENKEMIKKSDNTREIFELMVDILTVMTKAKRNKEGNNKEEYRFSKLESVISTGDVGSRILSRKLRNDSPFTRKQFIRIIKEMKGDYYEYNSEEIDRVLDKLRKYKKEATGRKYLYSEKFKVDPKMIPDGLSKVREYLLLLEKYLGQFRMKYNQHRLSDFSKGPWTTNFEFRDYEILIEQLQDEKSGLVVKNKVDEEKLSLLPWIAQKARKMNVPDYLLNKDGQPKHKWVAEIAFGLRKDTRVVAVEPTVFIKDNVDEKLLTGHVDLIVIIGKNIYICDYKPDKDINLNPSGTGSLFADTIPQVSSYALTFMEMFRKQIKDGDYNVFCYTFNKEGGIITDPYKSLKAYTEFYLEYRPEDPPPWLWLLNQFESHWVS
jgi:hypothetical protein